MADIHLTICRKPFLRVGLCVTKSLSRLPTRSLTMLNFAHITLFLYFFIALPCFNTHNPNPVLYTFSYSLCTMQMMTALKGKEVTLLILMQVS